MPMETARARSIRAANPIVIPALPAERPMEAAQVAAPEAFPMLPAAQAAPPALTAEPAVSRIPPFVPAAEAR